jgi:hypothetical protein
VVQHAGTQDQIEGPAEHSDLFDRQLVQLKVLQPVSSLECGGGRRLVALMSIPTTRLAGRRIATLAACEVPQPATNTDTSSL